MLFLCEVLFRMRTPKQLRLLLQYYLIFFKYNANSYCRTYFGHSILNADTFKILPFFNCYYYLHLQWFVESPTLDGHRGSVHDTVSVIDSSGHIGVERVRPNWSECLSNHLLALHKNACFQVAELYFTRFP